MSSECLICLEKINNGPAENMDLWICNHCNVEIHTHCKTQWDITNEENNTCPHCRTIENSTLVIFDNNNEELNENIPRDHIIYYFYCKMIIVLVFICFCCSFFMGILYLVLKDYRFKYYYNYTK